MCINISYAEDTIKIGKKVFRRKACSSCHVIEKETKRRLKAPNLLHVTERREREWLIGWLTDVRVYYKNKDPIIMRLIKKYGYKMPRIKLTPKEITAVLDYFESESIKARNKEKK
tara:strand:- start:22419 stop:22763 length:345 start_codon:yes stop_codon:yes gene_type:complete